MSHTDVLLYKHLNGHLLDNASLRTVMCLNYDNVNSALSFTSLTDLWKGHVCLSL